MNLNEFDQLTLSKQKGKKIDIAQHKESRKIIFDELKRMSGGAFDPVKLVRAVK